MPTNEQESTTTTAVVKCSHFLHTSSETSSVIWCRAVKSKGKVVQLWDECWGVDKATQWGRDGHQAGGTVSASFPSAAGASLCLEQRLKDAGQAGLALLGLLTPHLHHRHSSGVGTQHPECLWLDFFTCWAKGGGEGSKKSCKQARRQAVNSWHHLPHLIGEGFFWKKSHFHKTPAF